MLESRRHRLSGLALAIAIGGCKPSPDSTAPVQSAQPGQTAGSAQTEGVAKISSAVELLPPDTLMWVESASPRRAIEAVGVERLKAAFPEEYAEAVKESTKAFGVNVFDAAELPRIGIDPEGPFGIALLDPETETFIVTVTISDVAKFRTAVTEFAGRERIELVPTDLGGAEVFRDKYGKNSVVIRSPVAALISSRGSDDGPDYPKIIGTIHPAQSLAESSPFRRAMGGFPGGDLRGFLNLGALTAQVIAADQKMWARLGEDPGPQQQAAHELLTKLLGSFDTLGFQGQLRGGALILEGQSTATEGSFVHSLVRNHEKPTALSWALSGRPLFVAGGSFDTTALVDLVDTWARMEGTSYPEVVSLTKSKTGVDIGAELEPLLTGLGGGAVTLDGDPGDIKDLQNRIGLSLHVEVSDPEKARAVLDRLGAGVEIEGVRAKKHAATKGWVMNFPKYRPVYAVVDGRHLVVTTDAELPGRLAKGKAGNVDRKMKSPGGHGVIALPNRAFGFATDMALGGWLFFAGMADMGHMSVSTSDAKLDAKTKKTISKKKKELASLERDLDKLRDEVEGEAMKRMTKAIDALGVTAMSIQKNERGLAISGGHFLRADSIPSVLEQLAALSKETGDDPRKERLRQLEQKRMQLIMEIEDLQAPPPPEVAAPR